MKRKIIKWLCKHGHFSLAYRISPSLAIMFLGKPMHEAFAEGAESATGYSSEQTNDFSEMVRSYIENEAKIFGD